MLLLLLLLLLFYFWFCYGPFAPKVVTSLFYVISKDEAPNQCTEQITPKGMVSEDLSTSFHPHSHTLFLQEIGFSFLKFHEAFCSRIPLFLKHRICIIIILHLTSKSRLIYILDGIRLHYQISHPILNY